MCTWTGFDGTHSADSWPFCFKYLAPQRAKSEDTDLTEPEIRSRWWSYEAFPSFAVRELLRLIRRSRKLLPQVTCPLLIIHNTGDATIRAVGPAFAYGRAASSDKKLVTLHNARHAITVDSEREAVVQRTYGFARVHLTGGD